MPLQSIFTLVPGVGALGLQSHSPHTVKVAGSVTGVGSVGP